MAGISSGAQCAEEMAQKLSTEGVGVDKMATGKAGGDELGVQHLRGHCLDVRRRPDRHRAPSWTLVVEE